MKDISRSERNDHIFLTGLIYGVASRSERTQMKAPHTVSMDLFPIPISLIFSIVYQNIDSPSSIEKNI